MNRTVVLVDGLNCVYKSAYVYSGLKSENGISTGSIFGMLSQVFSLSRKVPGPFDVIVFWEGGSPNPKAPKVAGWRKQLVDVQYKAQRKSNPVGIEALKQVPYLIEAFKILGIPQVYVPGLEADDLIGIVSKQLESHSAVDRVYIYSTDKDFLQCVSNKTYVLRSLKGKVTVYKAKDVSTEYHVTPELFAEYKALCGDSSDNYASIKGVGPVTAARMVNQGLRPSAEWLDQPRSLRQLYRGKLADQWDLAKRCYLLAYIPRSLAYAAIPIQFRREAKEEIRSAFNLLDAHVDRVAYSHKLDCWTRFCARLQLHSFLVDRRQYFRHLVLS
jgi:5'-3' exonuclease